MQQRAPAVHAGLQSCAATHAPGGKAHSTPGVRAYGVNVSLGTVEVKAAVKSRLQVEGGAAHLGRQMSELLRPRQVQLKVG